MANICKNTITIIGLEEAPEIFVQELSKVMLKVDLDNMDPKRWGENPSIDGKSWYTTLVDEFRREGVYAARYGVLYPVKPYDRLGVTAPRFYCETKWEPLLDQLVAASKAFPTLIFHIDWWLQDGPSGEAVIKNGQVIELIKRRGSSYLFDWPLRYPKVSLLPAHLPFTLAQRAALRVQDAANIIEDLRCILDDHRFKHSSLRPFSECRDKQKTDKLQAGLTALHQSLIEQAKQLDFKDVFLEQHEMAERLPRILEHDNLVMQSLDLDPLLPVSGEAVRLSILPSKVAVMNSPYRAIVPVLHYLNADRTSGKYGNDPDGSAPPIDYQISYVCLTRSDMIQIKKLPDDDQTLFDIDITMTYGYGDAWREFNRVSNQARWKRNAELVAEVETKTAKVSDIFATKVAEKANLTIFNDFQTVEAALFAKVVD